MRTRGPHVSGLRRGTSGSGRPWRRTLVAAAIGVPLFSLVVPALVRQVETGSLSVLAADAALETVVGAATGLGLALSVHAARQARRGAVQARCALAELSHDLRNPLGTLVTVMECTGEPDPATWQIVRDEVRRLRYVADDLSAHLEQDGTVVAAARDVVHLGELTRRTVALLQGGTAVRIDHDADPVQVRVDGRLLERAVHNMMENAVRHARSSVKVEVRHDRPGPVTLAVENDGPPVAAPHRDAVFQHGVTSAGSARPGRPNRGLGLAVVRSAARRHGGAAVATASDDGCCRFELTIPAHRVVTTAEDSATR